MKRVNKDNDTQLIIIKHDKFRQSVMGNVVRCCSPDVRMMGVTASVYNVLDFRRDVKENKVLCNFT